MSVRLRPVAPTGDLKISTKIELEEPFKSKWRFGYLVVNKEPRRNVILFNSQEDRTTISYARYLYCVSIGQDIEKDLVVDHINGDKLDDRLDNFQLISFAENTKKGFKQSNKARLYVDFECGVCGKEFTKPKNTTSFTIKGKISDFCSRSCAGKSQGKIKSKVVREYRK